MPPVNSGDAAPSGFTAACGNGALNCDLRKGYLRVTCWLVGTTRLLVLDINCAVGTGDPFSSATSGLALTPLLALGCGVLYRSDILPVSCFFSAKLIYCWSGRDTTVGSGEMRYYYKSICLR